MSFMSKPHAASSSRHAVHEGIVQLVEDGLECQERLGLVIGSVSFAFLYCVSSVLRSLTTWRIAHRRCAFLLTGRRG